MPAIGFDAKQEFFSSTFAFNRNEQWTLLFSFCVS